MDNPTPQNSATRRQVLYFGAKAGSLLAISGLLTGLGGCSSNPKRKPHSTNKIGQPIPNDPVQFTHAPTLDNPRIYQPSIPAGKLTSLPSFVIPRSAWTRGKTKVNLTNPMQKITRITVHHDAVNPLPSGRYADSIRRLTSIRRGHLGNRWADIGYHYAIDPAGRAWQARPLTYQGAHVKHHNPGNIGIVLFGNYEKSRPTPKALQTLNTLIAHEMQRFNVPLNRIYTHQELRATACPGRHLQSQMVQFRRPNGTLAMLLNANTQA